MSHPVKLLVADDLRRAHATVFFRWLLAIPHVVWLYVWGVAALVAVIANWFATLVRGTPPEVLHRFLRRYLRYAVHVSAYVYLLAGPYPAFDADTAYDVDLEVAPPARQNRWTVGFRIVLAIPALLLTAALAGSVGELHGSSRTAGLLVTVAILGWFASLARARMPRGMRDAGAFALSYSAQMSAYLFLLTDRYPDSDPLAALARLPLREDPIRLELDDDLRRSRLTVFFRLLLAVPHLVWLTLWGVAATLAAIGNWFATLFSGRSPDALHRFLAAYLRYQTHVYAFLALTANPFPGFTGRAGSYPVDLHVAEPFEQNRWAVFFRLVLAVPAMLISSAYAGVLLVAAVLAWFAALVQGRMPLGLRNAQALALRYGQQLGGYLAIVTGAYPYSGPIAAAQPPPEPAPAPAIA